MMNCRGRCSNNSVNYSVVAYFALVLISICNTSLAADRPHIVLIVADDLGWNDVGFHGSNQIPTPNIDALAYNGIILNSHYVQATGGASRAALFTGRYPTKIGMQAADLKPADKQSLPNTGKILPQYFQDMGYDTHLVGKWNMGYSKWNETPTSRGFNHHFGIMNEFTSYYDFVSTWKFGDKEYHGFDLYKDKEPSWDTAGKYATDAFTDYATETIQNHNADKMPLFLMMTHLATHSANEGKPLEAPQEVIDKMKHIADPNRRTFAAMVAKLDESVGKVVSALDSKGMLPNTIIVFLSDNGAATVGPARNWGSNYPLRGIKNTLFEGGVRSVSFIWSPLLVQAARVSTDLIHVTDWLPTLFQAVGGNLDELAIDLDGIDQWSSLAYDLPSPRNDILLNIDEKTRSASLRFYNWKLIVGTTNNGTFDTYFGHTMNDVITEQEYDTNSVFESEAGKAIKKNAYTPIQQVEYDQLRRMATVKCLAEKAKKNPCDPTNNSICLYDIPTDPCEENDLAKFFPSVVRRMKRALVEYRKDLLPQLEPDIDIEKADPKLHDYTWSPWLDGKQADVSATS